MQRLLIWGGLGLGLIAMVWGLAVLSSKPVGQSSAGSLTNPVSSSDWVTGNLMAKNTLVEYADFQCPACASYHTLLKEIKKTYGNRLTVVFRHFPLPQHEHADLASRVAEAAGKQGKFWEMHDLLFEGQATWSGSRDPMIIFTQYATTLGLNVDQFKKDTDSSDTKKSINDDIASGNSSNVDATPTFYLNGSKLTNLSSYGDLELAIKSALGE